MMVSINVTKDVLHVSDCYPNRISSQLPPLTPISFLFPEVPYVVDYIDGLLSVDLSSTPLG